MPRAVGHPIDYVAGLVGGPRLLRIRHPAGRPLLILLDGLHEIVGHANRKVRVLEHDRTVGFAVEVGFVATLFDQHVGLLFFLPLALDEFHHVGVPHLDRLHLGGTAGLTAALHHGRHLVVHPHERKRTRGFAPTGEFFSVRTKRGKVGPRATPELEQHGLAAGKLHDVFHVVVDMLNETGRTLGEFIRVLGLHHFASHAIPTPVALRARHAVLMVQPDVEPHGRIERAMLMETQPR